MTFQEMYQRACLLYWGNSAPAQSAEELFCNADNGFLVNAHRKIQQLYNFWFMHAHAIISVYDGVQGYALPEGYKDLITAQFWDTENEDFLPPITPLLLADAQKYKWTNSKQEAEYPENYEIIDEAIILYPEPMEEEKHLTMVYWKFLTPPTVATFDTHEDELTIYGAEAIIFYALADMSLIDKEYDGRQRFMTKFNSELDLLKGEDYSRRQRHLIPGGIQISEF